MNITTEYKDRVLERFNNIKVGSVMEIKTDNEHCLQFIETVKLIIDWGQDLDNGYVLEFNDDYTAVKKKGATQYD
jgi:hypothetical protein